MITRIAQRPIPATFSIVIALAAPLALPAQVRQKPAPHAGVEEICTIAFDKDVLRPARVENSALPCLKEAAKRLKVSPDRIDTVANFEAVAKYGVKGEGSSAGLSAATLTELADLAAAKELEIPLSHTFPLREVRAAYTQLAKGHVRGKIVLLP